MKRKKVRNYSEKQCFKCKVTKPLLEFYKNVNMANGRLNQCKGCASLYAKRNRVKYRDYHRKYQRLPRCVEVSRIYDKTDARKKSRRLAAFNYKKKNPIKYKARKLLNCAVISGKVEKFPCEVCGCLKVHGHHENYEKPLDVRWLCPKHHKKFHRISNTIVELEK